MSDLDDSGSSVLVKSITASAGYDLPASLDARFAAVYAWADAREADHRGRASSSSRKRPNWPGLFRQSIYGVVRKGLAACYYHRDRASEKELEVFERFATIAPLLRHELVPVSGTTVANTFQIDFEY